jgi:hypothetical protein
MSAQLEKKRKLKEEDEVEVSPCMMPPSQGDGMSLHSGRVGRASWIHIIPA